MGLLVGRKEDSLWEKVLLGGETGGVERAKVGIWWVGGRGKDLSGELVSLLRFKRRGRELTSTCFPFRVRSSRATDAKDTHTVVGCSVHQVLFSLETRLWVPLSRFYFQQPLETELKYSSHSQTSSPSSSSFSSPSHPPQILSLEFQPPLSSSTPSPIISPIQIGRFATSA